MSSARARRMRMGGCGYSRSDSDRHARSSGIFPMASRSAGEDSILLYVLWKANERIAAAGTAAAAPTATTAAAAASQWLLDLHATQGYPEKQTFKIKLYVRFRRRIGECEYSRRDSPLGTPAAAASSRWLPSLSKPASDEQMLS